VSGLLPKGDRHLFESARTRLIRGSLMLLLVPVWIWSFYGSGYRGLMLMLPLVVIPFGIRDLYLAKVASKSSDLGSPGTPNKRIEQNARR